MYLYIHTGFCEIRKPYEKSKLTMTHLEITKPWLPSPRTSSHHSFRRWSSFHLLEYGNKRYTNEWVANKCISRYVLVRCFLLAWHRSFHSTRYILLRYLARAALSVILKRLYQHAKENTTRITHTTTSGLGGSFPPDRYFQDPWAPLLPYLLRVSRSFHTGTDESCIPSLRPCPPSPYASRCSYTV